MFNILFQKIPELLLIPVSILGLAGAGFSLYEWAKEKTDKMRLFLFLIMMEILLLRLLVKITASRYASILLLFAIPYALYAIRPKFTKYLPIWKKNTWSCLLLIVLIGCGIGKMIRFDNNYFLNGMNVLKQDMTLHPDAKTLFLVPDGGNINRVKYYTGAEHIITLKKGDLKNLHDTLDLLDRFAQPAYLLLMEKKAKFPADVEHFLEKDTAKKWEIIFQTYTNYHKTARFTIMRKKAEPPVAWNFAGKVQFLDNTELDESAGKNRLDAMRKIFTNSTQWYRIAEKNWDFPNGWTFDCSNISENDLFLEKTITEDAHGIPGSVLHIQGTDLSLYCRYAEKIPVKGKMLFSFYAKGTPHSKYIITFYLFNGKRRLSNKHYIFFHHADNQWHHQQIVVDPQSLEGADSMFPVLHFLSGDVYFDKFSLYQENELTKIK